MLSQPDSTGRLTDRPDDAEEPPIRLIEIDTSGRLACALRHPVRQEDRVLYTTAVPEYARRLAAAGLPCIFQETGTPEREEHDGSEKPVRPDTGGESGACGAGGVYGVDLVICEDDCCADAGTGWRADGELLQRVWRRHYHLPWTIARTERLLIRESVPEDLPELLALYEQERENPDVKSFSEEPGRELEAYIQNRYPFFGYGLWSVEEDATGRLVGRVGLEELAIETGAEPENGEAAKAGGAAIENGSAKRTFLQLSYLIAKEARRKGYGREAAEAALAYARENLAPARVALVTSPENTASRRLAESLGFRAAEGGKIYLINLLDKRIIYVYDV